MKSEISIANTDVAMASTCSGSEGTAHSVAVSADDLVGRATKGEFYAMAEYMINEHEDRLAVLSKYCVNTNLEECWGAVPQIHSYGVDQWHWPCGKTGLTVRNGFQLSSFFNQNDGLRQ